MGVLYLICITVGITFLTHVAHNLIWSRQSCRCDLRDNAEWVEWVYKSWWAKSADVHAMQSRPVQFIGVARRMHSSCRWGNCKMLAYRALGLGFQEDQGRIKVAHKHVPYRFSSWIYEVQ